MVCRVERERCDLHDYDFARWCSYGCVAPRTVILISANTLLQ